jgi:uncharacterized membrane protein YkoI
MLSRSTISIFAAVALSCGLVVLAAEQNQTQPDASAQNSAAILSLDEILQRVKAQYPGRVVETELEHKRDRYVYEIDVIGDDGVKKELKYDATTGALISSKVEDNDDDEDEDQ